MIVVGSGYEKVVWQRLGCKGWRIVARAGAEGEAGNIDEQRWSGGDTEAGYRP